MAKNMPMLGILQGRLTPSPDGSIQFFPKDNWRNEFVIAREIGFDCIELLVRRDNWEDNPLVQASEFISVGHLCQGLAIHSVHGFYSKSEDFKEALGRIIHNGEQLDVKTILVSFFGEEALITEDDKHLAREQISKVIPWLQRFSIRIGIEAEMPAAELLDFIKSFKSNVIGVYYDIGNMSSVGANVVEEIKFLGRYICGVHVKDRLAGGGKTVPLGEGCADFEGAFTALKDVWYEGPFIIQGARVEGVNDVELNRGYFKFCKELLNKIYGGGER